MTILAGFGLLGLVAAINPSNVATYWFALPLVIAMSCVYSASRHESWRKIIGQSVRLSGMILAILIGATALLLLINTRV